MEVEVIDGSLLRVAGDGQVGNLGKPLSDSLIVKVVDASGNGLPGVTVRKPEFLGSPLGCRWYRDRAKCNLTPEQEEFLSEET